MKRILFFILGGLCLLIGAVGIFLPILPTTPLLLASAWFFARSSQKFHHWLLYHPVFGEYIRDYIQKKAIKRSVRNRALMILWSGLILTMVLVRRLPVVVILWIIGSIVSIHILMLVILPETGDAPEES